MVGSVLVSSTFVTLPKIDYNNLVIGEDLSVTQRRFGIQKVQKIYM